MLHNAHVSKEMAKVGNTINKVGSRTQDPILAPQLIRWKVSLKQTAIGKYSCDGGTDKRGGSRSSE